jgi:glutamate formiminotransferase
MIPAAYADNKQKAEDDSAAATADCDHNDVERAGFDCFGIAANDIDVDLGGDMVLGFVDGIPSVYPRN